jgi:hypothetical protein
LSIELVELLVRAEVNRQPRLTSNGILHEHSVAIGAEIKTLPMVKILAGYFALVIQFLEYFLDLSQVVSVVFFFVESRITKRCVALNSHYVSQIILGIELSLTTVAREMKHS